MSASPARRGTSAAVLALAASRAALEALLRTHLKLSRAAESPAR